MLVLDLRSKQLNQRVHYMKALLSIAPTLLPQVGAVCFCMHKADGVFESLVGVAGCALGDWLGTKLVSALLNRPRQSIPMNPA